MKNPFDSIREPEVNNRNPGFYCVNFIEHNGHLLSLCNCPSTCEKQCDECVNKIIEHHAKKNSAMNENNQPQSQQTPSESVPKSSDRYIPQIVSEDGKTEQALRDMLKTARKRIAELESQLADANAIIKNLEP